MSVFSRSHRTPHKAVDAPQYLPEGSLIGEFRNTELRSSLAGLEKALREDRIIEIPVSLCDSSFSLRTELCRGVSGIIPREECMLMREGESVKDIAVLTRVGKAAACKVTAIERNEDGTATVLLSRRAAQKECAERYLSGLTAGDLIPAKVTHLEPFGAFCDIGCGIVALLSVDCISVSRISHPRDRLSPGDRITVAVRMIDRERNRIFLTMKELLGTWEENACCFEPGQTVTGIVRSIEPYGVFVELTPNLAGLAERSPEEGDSALPEIGASVAVYIKSILPERMKVKLVLIDPCRTELPRRVSAKPIRYFIDTEAVSHIDSFRYSPACAPRVIETVFSALR
jgi:small subunit ribosomal protein S1